MICPHCGMYTDGAHDPCCADRQYEYESYGRQESDLWRIIAETMRSADHED
jgi:hypothetical protein